MAMAGLAALSSPLAASSSCTSTVSAYNPNSSLKAKASLVFQQISGNNYFHSSSSINGKVYMSIQPMSQNKSSQMVGFRMSALSEQIGGSGGSSGGGNDEGGNGNGGNGGGGGGDEDGKEKNRSEALIALASMGKSLDNIPKNLAYAIQDGRVSAEIVERFIELEKNAFLSWLLQFPGFMERLLADDLFLTKVGIECGVGIFTKTAAEWERRRENFFKELDFVFADIVMALIADFMLVWLPAPTISLSPSLAKEAGKLAKFFHGCPDNAFQVARPGISYSGLQRVGAIVRNGSKLLVVGTSASLIGTGITNGLISVRRKLDKNYVGEVGEDVPILPTSLAYGVYMSISSNLRYQILAGVVEQRILEPLLHNNKLVLSAASFAVRTGNTFLGSLMWVDYARFVGVQ